MAGNSTYKKLAVQWLNKALPAVLLRCVLRIKFIAGRQFSASNPSLRKAPNRYASVQNQIKNMKFYAFIFLCLLIVSCSEKRTNRSLVSKPSPSNNELKTNKKEEDNHSSTVKDATNDVMLVNDILFNGKLKRYFTLKEFEITFGKPDSTKLLNEVQPCNIIFENSTGEIDQEIGRAHV